MGNTPPTWCEVDVDFPSTAELFLASAPLIFQAVEAANKYYLNVPHFVEEAFAWLLGEFHGRSRPRSVGRAKKGKAHGWGKRSRGEKPGGRKKKQRQELLGSFVGRGFSQKGKLLKWLLESLRVWGCTKSQPGETCQPMGKVKSLPEDRWGGFHVDFECFLWIQYSNL